MTGEEPHELVIESWLLNYQGGTSMAMSSFNELAEHVGHDVAVVTYGQRGSEVAAADNVAVECVTCAAVLLDFDNTDTPDAPPCKLAEATLSVQPPLAEAQFRRLEELTGGSRSGSRTGRRRSTSPCR